MAEPAEQRSNMYVVIRGTRFILKKKSMQTLRCIWRTRGSRGAAGDLLCRKKKQGNNNACSRFSLFSHNLLEDFVEQSGDCGDAAEMGPSTSAYPLDETATAVKD